MSLFSLSPRQKNVFSAWWQASRPPYYIATLVPLTLGWVQAGGSTGQWRPGLFALILLCCFFLHLAANLANDLFDHLQGIDGGDNIGGSRAIQEGKISIAGYVKALILLYGGAVLMAAAGAWHTGHEGIWGIILFAVFASLFYVAPPIRYGHRALGEVFVFLSMGVVMTAGTTYTLTGQWTSPALALSLPVGLMVAGILYFQSLPEIETDKAVGKRTLANVLGPRRAVTLFRLWWPVVWLFLLVFWAVGLCNWLVVIGIALSLPCYARVTRLLREVNGDWLSLDAHGGLVRKMYLACGVALICAVYWK
jgi:1,4-dihydroxy-2-naphthoate octaprenyltransferase